VLAADFTVLVAMALIEAGLFMMVFFRTTNHMRFSYPVGHSYPSAEREPAGFTGWSNIHISSVLSNIQSAFLEHRNGPLRLSIKRSQRRCSNTRVYLFGWKLYRVN
jgi:hypothetical protein